LAFKQQCQVIVVDDVAPLGVARQKKMLTNELNAANDKNAGYYWIKSSWSGPFSR